MLTPFGCSDDSALLEHAARQYRIECQRSLNYGLSLGANSQPVVVARQSMIWLCCVSYALFSSFRSHLSAPLSRYFRSSHWDRKWQTAGMTSASSWRSRDSTFEKCGILPACLSPSLSLSLLCRATGAQSFKCDPFLWVAKFTLAPGMSTKSTPCLLCAAAAQGTETLSSSD